MRPLADSDVSWKIFSPSAAAAERFAVATGAEPAPSPPPEVQAASPARARSESQERGLGTMFFGLSVGQRPMRAQMITNCIYSDSPIARNSARWIDCPQPLR